MPLLALTLALPGCVAVPRTVEVYDAECRMLVRRVVLDEAQVATIAGCANQGCVALIVGASAVTAVTYIVSGTIAVAGNIAYGIERQAKCRPAEPAVAPLPPGPAQTS